MKHTYSCAALIMMIMSACNSGPTEHTGINRKLSDEDSTFNICFTSTIKKDTVLFNGLVYGDSIKGSLGYKLYEKQQQNGSLAGVMQGDTIWGAYTFMSGDSEFVNEVTYLLQDSLLVEGIGERRLNDKIFVFTDKSKVRYDGIRLIRTDCRQTPDKK
jgi:hypothetical protein